MSDQGSRCSVDYSTKPMARLVVLYGSALCDGCAWFVLLMCPWLPCGKLTQETPALNILVLNKRPLKSAKFKYMSRGYCGREDKSISHAGLVASEK